MPKLKYTNKDRQRALDLYSRGMTGKQIEAVTGIKKGSVLKWARDWGIVRGRAVQLSQKEKEEIRFLYVTCKHTVVQIARITGVPDWTVFYYLSKNNLTRTKTEARRLREVKKQRRNV